MRKTTLKAHSNWPLFLTISVFFHFFIFLLGESSVARLLISSQQKLNIAQKSKPIELVDIKKYRTVGVKNGKKNEFSTPIKRLPRTAKRNSGRASKNSPLKSLSAFQAGKIDQNIKPGKNNLKISPSESASAASRMIRANKQAQIQKQRRRLQTVLKQDLMEISEQARENADILAKTDFDIKFLPPKGVSEDELNKAEQIFYSFQKRSYETYINSFVRAFNKFKRKFPHFNYQKEVRPESLLGKITFDNNGNIIKINFIRGSENYKIQKLFETTLVDMNILPNPPKAFVKEGQFSIFYQLNVQ